MYHQVFCQICGSHYHVNEACPIFVGDFQEPAFENANFVGWNQENNFMPDPQKVGGASSLEMMFAEFLAQQKESNARMDSLVLQNQNLSKTLEQLSIQNQILLDRVTQQTGEVELSAFKDDVEDCPDVEVLESFEDQLIDNSFDMLGQAFKGRQDEEDSAMEDDSLGAFPTQPTYDDLDSLFGDLLEEEHLEPARSHIHEDLVEDLDANLSDEPLHPQVSTSLEEDSELGRSENTIKCIEGWTPIRSGSGYEDPYLLTPPPSKFWCFQPFIANYEDPFLFAPPLSKFQSFRPFIASSFGRNSHDPSAPNETYLSKRSTAQLEVHRRLDGRKYKWDLKVV